MYLYLVVVLFIILLFCIYYIYIMSYDMNKLKLDFDIEMRMKNEYLSCLNKEKEKNQVLISDNIRLKAYNQVLEKQNMSLTNFTDNIADRTKKHFFDLGKSLTTQLIDLQRKESVAQRDEANNVINKSIKHITDRFDTVNQYVANLHNQLKASQDNFNKITDNILNPIKIQNLTEITLENILNASGIKKGYDFFIQPVIRSDNNILRPDALVKLPGDKILLIDAKSFSPNTDDLCRSMHTHLKQLSEKDYLNKALEYFNLSNVKSHMIAMFVASDSILDKVMNEDKDFLNKAWKKNIFPVGPTGLMNLLVMSKYSIDGYERDKNQEVIIEEVIKLLNSIFILFEHTKKSSRSLNAFNNNFNKIVACMNSSVFNSMNRISKLGLNHNKNLDALDKIPVNISYQFDDEVKQNYNF